MAKVANLFTTVSLYWQTAKGYERECDVEVDYTFGGDELTIVSAVAQGYDPDAIPGFDDMVWDAVMDEAPAAYDEWMADYGDYLHEQAIDRRAA